MKNEKGRGSLPGIMSDIKKLSPELQKQFEEIMKPFDEEYKKEFNEALTEYLDTLKPIHQKFEDRRVLAIEKHKDATKAQFYLIRSNACEQNTPTPEA
jgi:hypothetical protein